MDPIFTALDMVGLRDRPAEQGAFSVETLFVRYNFRQDELVEALRAGPTPGGLADPLKTVVHETTHLFHTTTTPFGFLIHAVRRLQAELVMAMINELRAHHKLKVRCPLVDQVFALPDEARDDEMPYLTAWYVCELFLMMALDNAASWGGQFLKNPMVSGIGISELFARVQAYLAVHYREQARKLRVACDVPVEGTPPLPFATFEPDQLQDSFNRGLSRMDLTSLVLFPDTNLIFVYESAGTASENWGNDRLTLDEFWKGLSGKFARRSAGYSLGVEMMRGSIPATSLREFTLSYLALCELALFGPVLPHHRHLRGDGCDLRQILPFFRWQELIRTAANVRPMASPDDYDRYVGELCAALGWIPLREIVHFTAADHVPMENDIFERTFLDACALREARPSIFQDYGFLLGGSGPMHERFLQNFTFPIVQYTDKTVYIRDKIRLRAFTLNALIRSAFRSILIRDRPTQRMPYRCQAEEVEACRDMLVDALEKLIHIRVDGLELVPA